MKIRNEKQFFKKHQHQYFFLNYFLFQNKITTYGDFSQLMSTFLYFNLQENFLFKPKNWNFSNFMKLEPIRKYSFFAGRRALGACETRSSQFVIWIHPVFFILFHSLQSNPHPCHVICFSSNFHVFWIGHAHLPEGSEFKNSSGGWVKCCHDVSWPIQGDFWKMICIWKIR